MVWSIFDNAWVTRQYWEWVNGRIPSDNDNVCGTCGGVDGNHIAGAGCGRR